MASKQIIHCPPFCYVDCKTQHHPLLLALINVRENKPEQDFIGLEAVMKRYEQLGEWNKDANIPDPNPDYRYPLLHWAASLADGKEICQKDEDILLKQHNSLLQNVKIIFIYRDLVNMQCDILVVKWLLYDKKCRPGNQWSENGDTVLHRMIDSLIDNTKLNNKQISKIIKEIMPHFKCNLVMKNKEGNTPLHVCCAPLQQISKAKRQYYTEWIHSMIELMKDHPMTLWNIAVNSQNNDGDTPLHILAEFSNNLGLIKDVLESDCTETFIKFGLQNNKKMTALETAIKHGNVKTSSYLSKCMYLHKLPGTRSDEEVKSVRHSPRILQHQKKGENEEQLSSEDKKKSSRKISSNNSSPEQCKPPTKKNIKSDDMVGKTVAKQTSVTDAGENICEEKTPAGNDRQKAMTTTAGNGAHIAGTSLSTPNNGSSNNSTDNPVQAFKGYPKIMISQGTGIMQYSDLPKGQGIVLNDTTNNTISSVQTEITPSNCSNKTNIASISSQPLVMNSQFNATFTTPAVHGIPTSQVSSLISPNVPIVIQSASLPCSILVRPRFKVGEDGPRILAIKPTVPNSVQQNSTNLVSSICRQKEDMSCNLTLIKPRPVFSTHQSVTISPSQPLSVSVPIISNTTQSESQSPIDHLTKSNSTNMNSASLSSSSLAQVSMLNTTGPSPSILSAAATISSTTSPFSQQKRKSTSLLSSSSQETLVKYIKLEDDDSLEIEAPVVSQSVTSPSDNLIHSSVSDSELQQEGTKHNIESLPSPSNLSTAGSVDSEPGNQTGRAILSYLSMCSENTKQEFLDKLMKDKEKYSLEKDNIEKMYTEISDKKAKKMEKVKRRTEAVTFHLKKVVEVQDELYKLNEDVNAISKLESELMKLKHSVKKKLETCENAVSDFSMLS